LAHRLRWFFCLLSHPQRGKGFVTFVWAFESTNTVVRHFTLFVQLLLISMHMKNGPVVRRKIKFGWVI
jgi:hypothetical protein